MKKRRDDRDAGAPTSPTIPERKPKPITKDRPPIKRDLGKEDITDRIVRRG